MLLSTALDAIYKKIQKLGEHKFWFLYLGLVFIVVIVINGIGIVPEEHYQRLSQNPFTTRTDIHFNNYWQETLLLPIIAYYLGLTGTITFNALTFILAAGAYSTFAWLMYRRWGAALSLIISTLLITSPLSTVIFSWLGTPDSLTVLLTTPFIFFQSGVFIFFLALLGAANHPAFIIAILEILVLRWIARDRINIKHLFLAILGAGTGYGSVKFFLHAYDIEIVSRLDFMQLMNISDWSRMNLEILPTSLFSLFNVQWLALFVCFLMFYRKDKRFYSMTGIILLLNYGMVFFTLDTTRVYSLLSWGVFFVCIFHSYKLAKSIGSENPDYIKQFSQALMLTGTLSIFAPRYFSWAGKIHATPFFEWIGKLIH